MPQAPYGDAESLFRAAHNELMRVAYALLGNRADTEDAAQDSFFKLMTAWHRVGGLPTPDEQRAYLFRIDRYSSVFGTATRLRSSGRVWMVNIGTPSCGSASMREA